MKQAPSIRGRLHTFVHLKEDADCSFILPKFLIFKVPSACPDETRRQYLQIDQAMTQTSYLLADDLVKLVKFCLKFESLLIVSLLYPLCCHPEV